MIRTFTDEADPSVRAAVAFLPPAPGAGRVFIVPIQIQTEHRRTGSATDSVLLRYLRGGRCVRTGVCLSYPLG